MDKLQTLVDLTLKLGEPQRNYIVVGEGNTSTRIDDDTFYVKASGYQMETITADGFVAVHFEPVLAMLDNPPSSLAEEKAIADGARVNPDSPIKPSVETSFHAMLLHECGVQYVGHTHPTAVNQVMCSTWAEQYAANRIFPDQAVVCGPESVLVPYASPGLPLAIEMRNRVRAYMGKHGKAPKEILLKSHGYIALGETPKEVLNIMAMGVKAAAIFVGACSIGEPVFMSAEDIEEIVYRPDEIYRRRLFVDEQ